MKKKAKGIGASLTRKLGPLPVWAWALIVFAGVWYYRNKTSQESGTGTGSVTPTPPTPQDQTVLQPGESVYDPNTGLMSTAPGGDTTGGDTTGSVGEPGADGMPGAMGPPGAPGASRPPQNKTRRPRAKLRGKGAIRAPSGPRKPHKKKGYRIVGLGKGAWEYVPTRGKRADKPKNQHGKPAKTTGSHGKPRTDRSSAANRNHAGGRTHRTITPKVAPKGRTRGGAKPNASKPRVSSKKTVPVVGKPVVRQRPVASTAPKAKPAPKPAPRPSAPKARTPARKPAPARRPPARKR